MFSAISQRRLAAACLDRHARHLRRHVDQLDVLRVGQPRLAVIHGEGAQHRVVVAEDRRGPDGAQPVAHRDLATLVPQRIGGAVARVHRFSQIGCGAARSHVGSDREIGRDVDLVVLRYVRRGREVQPLLLGVGEQHGATQSG